jgi:hypothetical protein
LEKIAHIERYVLFYFIYPLIIIDFYFYCEYAILS